MVFDIYEYVTGKTATVIIGGHNWNTPQWYNNGCQVVGWTDKSVRLGVKNGRYCVVFGGVGSTWSYATIRLRKIHNSSVYNNVMDLLGNWSTEFTNTESFTYVTGDLRQLRTSNTFTADGDVRSPIFYDSNDTSYYTNPNGSSRLYSFDVVGNPTFFGGYGGGSGPGLGVENQNTFCRFAFFGLDFYDWNVGQIMTLDSYVLGHQSVRSPIFYDSNNTAYYIDPNTTGISLNIAGEIWTYGNNKKIAWSVDGSTDSVPNVSLRGTTAASGDLVVQNWSGSASNDNFWVIGSTREARCAGNITAYYSDQRLKTRTGLITDAITKVQKLEGFTYIENETAKSFGYNNNKQQVGVSAQMVQEVLPEAVSLAPFDIETLEDGTIASKSGENYLTVDYSRIVPLLIEAIKEQQTVINNMQAEINSLKRG
jgi:hypothetical protein